MFCPYFSEQEVTDFATATLCDQALFTTFYKQMRAHGIYLAPSGYETGMVAKNTAETDDQIIDLTELIEKGEVPANDPSEQPQAAAAPEVEADQEALNAHLRGLNDGSSAADAEIDDLLAQMDIKDEGQSDPNDVALDFSAPSTQTDHPIDPNEQLLMSALPMAGGTHMLLRGFAGAVPRFSINKTKGRGLLLPFLNPSRQYPLWVTAVPQRGGFFIFAAPFRAGS